MLTTIHAYLSKHLGSVDDTGDDQRALQLATAVLLMEVARADTRVTAEERQAIRRVIEDHFALPSEDTRSLTVSAEREAKNVTSLYPFTRLINTECSLQDRIQIIRMLWEVTLSDGHKDDHEEHLIRKLARLLHVPHREFIRAKLQVIDG
ncbi:MAG: TerB family tellurite resistance protein [Saprospiraceae bacterium]|nr:TerB family tellurite resistance protein [Saprospiraceae bacterium]